MGSRECRHNSSRPARRAEERVSVLEIVRLGGGRKCSIEYSSSVCGFSFRVSTPLA